MLRTLSRSFHHPSIQFSNTKNLLSKLRKKTGFSFVNCKKALQLHENDIQKAEQWLKEEAQKQGWDKATKLQGRPTVQGLVGILTDKHSAAIIELNCETDFVARNIKFQDLTAHITNCCHHQAKSYLTHVNNLVTKWECNSDELKTVQWQGDKSLADFVALNIGRLGENMSLCRGSFMKLRETHNDIHISHYVHGETGSKENLPFNVSIGKYGALIALRKLKVPEKLPCGRTLEQLGRQLCQHIVGMNPSAIGDHRIDKPNKSKDEEGLMVYQEFLLDPEFTVLELIQQSGVEIVEHVRYECGETTNEAT